MESQYISQSPRTVSKKTVVVAAIALVAVVGAFCVFNTDASEFRFLRYKTPVDKAWEAWKVKNNRTYGGPEDKVRLAVFKQNYKKVMTHNAKRKNYTLGLNKFADLTTKEFASIHLGAKKFNSTSNGCAAPSALTSKKVPATLDWRTQGRVGPVKDQGQCGSCWAFSTVGAIEGLAAKTLGTVGDFAEQQLVDCSGDQGNQGCNGGWVQYAFAYVLANGGITNEANYAYTAQDGTCDTSVAKDYKISDCADVAVQSVDALKEALQNGPVSIYIEADQSDFQLYTGGVFDSTDCFAEGQIDHAVLAVGYTADAWIVKNSWGTSWGDNGYIQISTETKNDANGVCGILSTPNTYPL